MTSRTRSYTIVMNRSFTLRQVRIICTILLVSRTKKSSAEKPQPTARVGWRLPVWLSALSRLGSNDEEMQREVLKQLAAGPPKAAKRNSRKTQDPSRSRPTHYQTLAFLGDIESTVVTIVPMFGDWCYRKD